MSTSVAPVNQGASSSGIHEPLVMPQNYQHYDPFNEMNDMITNTLGFNVSNYVPNVIDDPNDDEYDADVNVERPNEEAKSYYEAKQLVAKLGFGVKRIDCCVNDSKPKYWKKFGMNSEKKWNKAWNNVCNNFSRLNEMQLRRGREQHKGLFTSQNDNTRQSSSSQPQQSNHRNHPSSSRGYFADTSEETPSHHLASPVLLPTLSSSFFDVLCPIDNRAGTLKKMGKLALFFEFVLMGIWMKFVALLGNGG
ncbi:hypothetical protein QL285_050944 [Trifolium repens]|nr:hypothetical protein QL285_050944 [Trifolium repens]